MWSICVHGGAGKIPDSLETAHRAGCGRAVEAGAAVLEDGGGALEAVCAAVRVLEADPLYNAGRGAALDARGQPALDAAVMRGSDLAYGAVGAVLGVEHPVDAARAVLEDGRHCLLVGSSAVDFARRRGLSIVSPDAHLTPGAEAAWRKRHADLQRGAVAPSEAEWDPEEGLVAATDPGNGNTVGAVARDARGELAAATSTGGLLMRTPGRVGDSPIAGAGTYADVGLGAASATGHGETMMRTVFTHQLLRELTEVPGTQAAERTQAVLDVARNRVGGTGGVIVVRPDGDIVYARNTPHMGVAWKRAGQEVQTDF